MQEKGSIHAETEKEDKPYPPGGVCPACGAGAQPGAFDWMRLGRQHDRVGKKNEKGYSRAEVMVIAMTEKKRYEEVCTDQIWGVSVGEKGDDFETYLKKQIRSFMDELKIMNLLAADRGISLTSEERAAMDRAAAEYFGRLPQSAIDRWA